MNSKTSSSFQVKDKNKDNFLRYLRIKLTGDEPDWCVDGRPCFEKKKGPQMLGGVIHPIILYAIWKNIFFDEELIYEKVSYLISKGVKAGAHRGLHKDLGNGKCDCGFCDRNVEVIKKALSEEKIIRKRLLEVYQRSSGIIDIDFGYTLNLAYEKLKGYDLSNIKISGEDIVAVVEKSGAEIEYLAGEHAEICAFINLRSQTTLDTNHLNINGVQSFNLDLWAVLERIYLLDSEIDKNFVIGASLVLYLATEMVIVEDVGKPRLKIEIVA